MNHLITALGGSIVVAAGRVMFGWVPKTSVSYKPLTFNNNPDQSPSIIYNIICDDGETLENLSFANQSQADHAANVASDSCGCCFYAVVSQ